MKPIVIAPVDPVRRFRPAGRRGRRRVRGGGGLDPCRRHGWALRAPNITLGPVVVEAVRRATDKPLNVHLMIVQPELMLDDFIGAGADHVIVQAEPSSTIHLHRVLSRIK